MILTKKKKKKHKKTCHIYPADLSQISWKSKTGNIVISYLLWL